MYCLLNDLVKCLVEFRAAGPAQEKSRLPYVHSRHLGTSRSPRVTERS